MNKQTQMYVGLGVAAVAAYFIYKSMGTKKSFMNASASKAMAPNCGPAGGVSDARGCGCPPKNGAQPIATANDGTSIYANGHTCCGTKTGPCPPKQKSDFVGDNTKVFKGDNFVGNNSKVFKGDNFVGDNSKVFKGDNFVGDNSKVFKGDR